ncbi:FH2 domain-containing protein 1-like [Channa argus]|uniref:FH2 domain-containing protein 1-like n=1 Tax=Channa argus TaxID=215402 RepID=UPI002944B587|nr:hypothetical protein Q8A73_012782 [Channa argus]
MHVMGSVSPASERGGDSPQEESIAALVPTSPPSPPASRFSDFKVDQIKPPPPPPPPPPLPVPPPPPGLEDPSPGGDMKKKRVRSFYWKIIPEEQVRGRSNLWTQGRVRQQYQIDIQTIEELFGQNDRQPKVALARGGMNRSSFREAKEQVSILDSKRAMNIAIFLKQFKRSNQTIVDDICQGNSEPYGAEPLRELLKLLPDTEELKKLKAYQGDVSKLSLADSFVYLLIQLPSFSVRIESMLLKEEFSGVCEAMNRDITTLRSATKELMSCEELHAVLHLVLQAGNILNAGGYAGNAVGFKLSSLLSLADTKANKPGMNLLHFVALEAQKKDEKLLEFPLKLTHVPAAARISIETLDTELQWITTRTHSVEENIQRDTELLQQLDSFLQSATSSLCSLRGSRQQLKKDGSILIDFFCEDRETFRLDECFNIFHTFCSRFTKAVQENIERETKEAALRRRLQELEEQKRHSWAGGEEVGGVFRLRCSSETDMSRHNEAGLLMELLTLKSSPRSGVRRSRKSPSSSPSFSAERELSMLLETASPDHKFTQQRRGVEEARTALTLPSPESGLKSPRYSSEILAQTPDFSKNQQLQVGDVAQQTRSSPPKNAWSLKSRNSYNTATTYLSYDATQMPADVSKEVTLKPTSDLNQQFDHNNNDGKDQINLGHHTQSDLSWEPTRINKADPDLSGRIISSDDGFKQNTKATRNMSVVLETCTLVPELKVFGKSTTLSDCNEVLHGCQQDDIVITDLGEVSMDESCTQKVQNNPQIQKTEKSDNCSSLPQREEDVGQEEKVVVWCVTGVCETAGELTDAGDTHTQTQNDQGQTDNQGGNRLASSAPASRAPLEFQPANEKPVPVPISSQPVPVSRCDLPLQGSSPRFSQAECASALKAPALNTGPSKEGKEEASSQKEQAKGSNNEKRDVEKLQEQSTDDKVHTASCHPTNSNTATANSSSEESELASLSKPSANNFPTSKTLTEIKSTTPNANSSTSKRKLVRTLTNSENQVMRRVVPISRTGRGPLSLFKRAATIGGSSSNSTPTSLTSSSRNSGSLQRERPSTAPSSRRSSINKKLDPKELKNQRVSGTQASGQDQNQDLHRRLSVRKTLPKPKPQQEEKMCRSTLRALSLAGERGGVVSGGSVSAPATPLHKASTHSSSPLPGFARSTASSSFRWTHTLVTPPGTPRSSHPSFDVSPKSKTATSSSVPLTGPASHLTRTSSLRVSTTRRSSDGLNSVDSTGLNRSQSIRAQPHSPLTMPAKAHQRKDSGSFSDKSTHSRDSSKTTRPNWR